jgi:hypothetical protein
MSHKKAHYKSPAQNGTNLVQLFPWQFVLNIENRNVNITDKDKTKIIKLTIFLVFFLVYGRIRQNEQEHIFDGDF